MEPGARWPDPATTGQHLNEFPPRAFNEALAYVANIHIQEITHLRDQVAQLRGSFSPLNSEQFDFHTAEPSSFLGGGSNIVWADTGAANGIHYRQKADRLQWIEEVNHLETTRSGQQNFHDAIANPSSTDVDFAKFRQQLDPLVLIDDPDVALNIATDIANTPFELPTPNPRPAVKLINRGPPAETAEAEADFNVRDDDSSHVREGRHGRNAVAMGPAEGVVPQLVPGGFPSRASGGGEYETKRIKSKADRARSRESMAVEFEKLGPKVDELNKLSVKKIHGHAVAELRRDSIDKFDSESIEKLKESTAVAATATSTSSERRLQDKTKLDLIVESSKFDLLCGLAILLNSILLGYNVNENAVTGKTSVIQKRLGDAFSIFFLIEMVLRMINQKLGYFNFTIEQRKWNLFDMVLVFQSIVDFVMEDILKVAESSFSSVKTIKMLRILRIFRVFRFMHELAVLVLMILDSMMSLIWALLMLIIIMYVFAILFTSEASSFFRSEKEKVFEDQHLLTDEVNRWFGTVPVAIYTLFQALLGGVSWGVVTDALFATGPFLPALFFFYISFTMLVVLNIITGVFVENAMEIARSQREFLIQKEMELREKYVKEMQNLFEKMDEDGSGTVNLEEVLAYLVDPHVRGYFTALGLDPHDVERLFNLIDIDQQGEVSVEEFLDGCLRLKGMARSIDVHHILNESRKIEKQITVNFALLKQAVGVKEEAELEYMNECGLHYCPLNFKHHGSHHGSGTGSQSPTRSNTTTMSFSPAPQRESRTIMAVLEHEPGRTECVL